MSLDIPTTSDTNPGSNDHHHPTDTESDQDGSSNESCRAFEEIRTHGVNIAAHDETIMFPESKITVAEVLLMITGLSLRFHMPRTAQDALLEMVQLLAGPRFAEWNISNYRLSKQFDPPEDKVRYVFYCTTCNVPLGEPLMKSNIKNQEQRCGDCDLKYVLSSNAANHFMCIDIKYQIQLLLNDSNNFQDILQTVESIKRSRSPNDVHTIKDVHDGQIYKDIIINKQEDADPTSLMLSYNFNTDGAPLFHSSKKSFWPLQLILNELPAKTRFRNLILAGVWISQSEPTPQFMNLFMNYFVKQAKTLEDSGFTVENEKMGTFKITLVPYSMCVDSVARPIIQNRLQFNGYSGCSWCYANGEFINGSMRYPMTENDPPLRSHASHLADVKEIALFEQKKGEETCTNLFKKRGEKKYSKSCRKIIRGVKGPMSLLQLRHFDSVWGFAADYLHRELHGVVRPLWDFWTTPGTCYYLDASKRTLVNQRLLKIKPPHEIHRLPRSLNDRKKWKASEWRSWLLFYSLPCLMGILENNVLRSFMLFVRSIYTLLQPEISENDLTQCRYDLVKFVGESQLIYGKAALTFNVHSLLHLVDSVQKSGPLWATSTFPFESSIYTLKQQINGPKGEDQQMVTKFLKLNAYKNHIDHISKSEKCSVFCKNLFTYQHRIHHTKSADGQVLFIGQGNCVKVKDLQIGCDEIDGQTEVKIFKRCVFKGIILHSTAYTRPQKSNDTSVRLHFSGKIVVISNFVLVQGHCFVIATELITSPVEFETIEVRHILHVSGQKLEPLLLPIEAIQQKVVMINAEECFVCTLPNNFEIQ